MNHIPSSDDSNSSRKKKRRRSKKASPVSFIDTHIPSGIINRNALSFINMGRQMHMRAGTDWALLVQNALDQVAQPDSRVSLTCVPPISHHGFPVWIPAAKANAEVLALMNLGTRLESQKGTPWAILMEECLDQISEPDSKIGIRLSNQS